MLKKHLNEVHFLSIPQQPINQLVCLISYDAFLFCYTIFCKNMPLRNFELPFYDVTIHLSRFNRVSIFMKMALHLMEIVL